ncbi:toll/interleukin-1 receptor domain-containing protein [Thiothrix subterranea]|uniref:Toll/interleukin-1 receptor domain-containing protein n=1 Tax=Thiothrix subterranea TaxID=2735563 RepID=A0AA51QZC1_9GAMM|nr:toll/interleukin-1 receptor domain-containing protein [Thiothrix subterranea]MDQ5770465.1 toll/interleukin-1 receptor domain-containing protein [Thiothrix subterranea]WML86857.1 toll/interleukin-1 receptor domain-containing protein [Thiothrix subterranea]
MSDIAVKKLAEIIDAPVEFLLKQLQDSGIRVDGADAWITDAQKLKLLAHIRQGASVPGTDSPLKHSEAAVKSGIGQRGKRVSVEVRRKKVFVTSTDTLAEQARGNAQSTHATSGVSHAEELARQLSAERQAIQKLKHERDQIESRSMEHQLVEVVREVVEQKSASIVTSVVDYENNGKKAFISYARDGSHGENLAVEIQQQLQVAGFVVFRDVSGLKPGDVWYHKLESELETSDVMVLVVSEKVRTSKWVHNEVSMAEEIGIPVIPVLAEKVRYPLWLRHLQSLDFCGVVDWSLLLGAIVHHVDAKKRVLSSLTNSFLEEDDNDV